jgi:hypothetical protein
MVPSIAPPEDFARFPNELVLDMARSLANDRDVASSQALSRMGRLNHSYRQLSEEFLYEYCDTTALPMAPFNLLRTFLERPDLAVKVKSLVLSPLHVFVSSWWKEVGFVPWATPRTLAPFLQGLTPRVLDLIEKSQLLCVAKQSWRYSVISYHPAAWYGVLLALTPNLTEVTLDVWHKRNAFPDMLSLAPLATLANEQNSPILRRLKSMNVTFTPVDRPQYPIGFEHPERETITLVTELPGIERVKNLTVTVEPSRTHNQYRNTEVEWQANVTYTWGDRASSMPTALENLTLDGWCPTSDLRRILAHCHSLRSFT